MAASFSGGLQSVCICCMFYGTFASVRSVRRVGDVAGRSFQMDLACGAPPQWRPALSGGGCTPLRPEVVVCMVTGGFTGTTVETWYWRGLCLWDVFTPLILGAGRESCLSWVCLCLSGSCVFVVFLSRLRGLAWSPLSQLLQSRRLLSCLLTSPVVLGVRFFGLRGYMVQMLMPSLWG